MRLPGIRPRAGTPPAPGDGRPPASRPKAAPPDPADQETAEIARLPGGPVPYTLRRSTRARRLRVTIHPEHGVIATLPATRRVGQGAARGLVEGFLAEREPWLRRHLDRQAATREHLADRPPLDDGRVVPYLGLPHRVRVVAAPVGVRASRVVRVGGDEGDELLVERTVRDARPTAVILEAWFRARARAALEPAVERHAQALGVSPAGITIRDTTSRWGSCSRKGALSFGWRLVLATPAALDAVAAHEVCHLREFGHGPRFWALLGSLVPDYADTRRWLRRHGPELHAALD